MRLLRNLLLFAVALSIFSTVLCFIEPPKTWVQASIWQILAFFVPLLASVTLLTNIIVNYLPWSFLIGLGIMLVVVFYTLNQLTIISGTIILTITGLSVKVFPKIRYRVRLTTQEKISKLRLEENEPKLPIRKRGRRHI